MPEQISEEFGIDEGDEVVVDIRAVLKTAERRVDVKKLRESLRALNTVAEPSARILYENFLTS